MEQEKPRKTAAFFVAPRRGKGCRGMVEKAAHREEDPGLQKLRWQGWALRMQAGRLAQRPTRLFARRAGGGGSSMRERAGREPRLLDGTAKDKIMRKMAQSHVKSV